MASKLTPEEEADTTPTKSADGETSYNIVNAESTKADTKPIWTSNPSLGSGGLLSADNILALAKDDLDANEAREKEYEANLASNPFGSADVIRPPKTTLLTGVLGTSTDKTILDLIAEQTTKKEITSKDITDAQERDLEKFRSDYKSTMPLSKVTPVIDDPINEFNPLKTNNRADSSNASPEQIITSADMSVFYVSEIPDMSDMLDPGICSSTWRKDLVVFEMDAVMSIGYSTIRERYPVRSMGHANPRSHTKGPRTIAGHIAFAIFVDDVLGRLRTQLNKKLTDYSSKLRGAAQKNSNAEQNLSPPSKSNRTPIMYSENIISDPGANTTFPEQSTKIFYPGTPEWSAFVARRMAAGDPRGSAYFNELEMNALMEDAKNDIVFDQGMKDYETNSKIAQDRGEYYNQLIENFDKVRKSYDQAFSSGSQLLDSLPPFHLLVMGTNEAGHFSKFMIKDVVIVDENQHQGVQQPNIINKVQFVAQDIIPMGKFDYKGNEPTRSLNSIEENYGNGAYNVNSRMNELPGSNLMSLISKDLFSSDSSKLQAQRDQPWTAKG